MVPAVNQVTETIAVGHSVGFVLEAKGGSILVIKSDHAYTGDLDSLRALPLRSAYSLIRREAK